MRRPGVGDHLFQAGGVEVAFAVERIEIEFEFGVVRAQDFGDAAGEGRRPFEPLAFQFNSI